MALILMCAGFLAIRTPKKPALILNKNPGLNIVVPGDRQRQADVIVSHQGKGKTRAVLAKYL